MEIRAHCTSVLPSPLDPSLLEVQLNMLLVILRPFMAWEQGTLKTVSPHVASQSLRSSPEVLLQVLPPSED